MVAGGSQQPRSGAKRPDPLLNDPLVSYLLGAGALLFLFKTFGAAVIAQLADQSLRLWRGITPYLLAVAMVGLLLCISAGVARFRARRGRAMSLRQAELILARDDIASPHEVAGLLTTIYNQLRVRRPLLGVFTGDWTRWWLGTDHICWEMNRLQDGVIRFLLTAPQPQMTAIMGRLQATYPNLRFGSVVPVPGVPMLPHTYQMRLARRNHYLFTLKTQKDYETSVVDAIAGAWTRVPGAVDLQFVIRPRPLSDYRRLKKHQLKYQEKHLAMENTDPNHPGIGYVQDKELKASLESIGHGIFAVEVRLQAESMDLIGATVGALGESAGSNALIESRVWLLRRLWRQWFASYLPSLVAFPAVILSSAHLASIIHLPTVRLRGTSLVRNPMLRAVAGDCIQRDPDRAILADERGPISIHDDARKYGLRILGVQGMGKSTLMLSLIHADLMTRQKAIFVLDPKSDLARDVMAMVPPHVPLTYLDFTNSDNDVQVPLFRYAGSPDVLADNIISAFKSVFGADSIGARSDSLLRNAIYAVAEIEGERGALTHVYQLLIDQAYRQSVVAGLRSEFQRSFWTKQDEMASKNARLWDEITAAPRNKLERILAVRSLHTALVSGKRRIDLEEIIRQKGVMVANLGKAFVGESNSSFAGSVILSTIWQAVQSQARLEVAQRAPVALFVDEAHNLANESTALMLAEGRAFGIEATFAHQHRGQIKDESARSAFESLLQNRVIFRTEDLADAEYFAKISARVHSQSITTAQEMQERLTLGADDLMGLPRYHAAVRLVVDGEPQPIFLARTLDHRPFLRNDWLEINLARTAGRPAPPETDNASPSFRPDVSTSEEENGEPAIWEELAGLLGATWPGAAMELRAVVAECRVSYTEAKAVVEGMLSRPSLHRGIQADPMGALRAQLNPGRIAKITGRRPVEP